MRPLPYRLLCRCLPIVLFVTVEVRPILQVFRQAVARGPRGYREAMSPPLPRPGARSLRGLQAVGENPALAAIRAGLVALVPLTILGGLFLVLTHLPLPGGAALPAAWKPFLEVRVTATFGLLGVFACFAIAAPPFARTYGFPFSNF